MTGLLNIVVGCLMLGVFAGFGFTLACVVTGRQPPTFAASATLVSWAAVGWLLLGMFAAALGR